MMVFHRKVDQMGRVVLPVDMREMLEIREGDELEVSLEGGSILLTKASPCCTFCGREHPLLPYRQKHICPHCLQALHTE